jgi:phenylacetate-CoA ligase
MPLVEEIIGRQEDYLFTQERGFVGRLDPVFKKSPPSIIESQIVQIEVDKIILRIVPDRSRFAETDLDVILNEMRVRLGNVAIEVEYHDVLPRGSNGKLQAVVNLVGVSREFDLAEIG